MISQEDIDALAPDDEVLDRIQARAEAGATEHRLIFAQEQKPLVRAAVKWREIARLAMLHAESLAKQVDDFEARTARGLWPED